MYFPVATFVSYLFFFGIGGYLHVSTACFECKVFILKANFAVHLLCRQAGEPRGVEVSAQQVAVLQGGDSRDPGGLVLRHPGLSPLCRPRLLGRQWGPDHPLLRLW